MSTEQHKYILNVITLDGRVQHSSFTGYFGETAADYYFNKAKADENTISASIHVSGDIRSHYTKNILGK